MTGAYGHRWENDEPQQTELNMNAELPPPYNGQFWCFIRQDFFGWLEYNSFYKRYRL